jgi:hypothetical protein
MGQVLQVLQKLQDLMIEAWGTDIEPPSGEMEMLRQEIDAVIGSKLPNFNN